MSNFVFKRESKIVFKIESESLEIAQNEFLNHLGYIIEEEFEDNKTNQNVFSFRAECFFIFLIILIILGYSYS